MNLSDHFTLAELTVTENRAWIEENGQPDEDVMANLRKLARSEEHTSELQSH